MIGPGAGLNTNKSRPTGCLEGSFTQGVNLRVPRSEAVQVVRGCPLVTVVSRPFWHGCGTPPGCKLPARTTIGRPSAASPWCRWSCM
jgi:hypothetical protein